MNILRFGTWNDKSLFGRGTQFVKKKDVNMLFTKDQVIAFLGSKEDDLSFDEIRRVGILVNEDLSVREGDGSAKKKQHIDIYILYIRSDH